MDGLALSLFFMLVNSTTAYASGIRQSKLATGTVKLIGDATTWLMVLTPVLVGALLMEGLYTLFKDTILPTLTQKITSLFNYQG